MSAKLIYSSDILPDSHYILKCLFVGEPCAGKTCIISRLADGNFYDQQETTIGIDFRSLNAVGEPLAFCEPTRYKLQCWDCSGQIRFRSIVKSYYRFAQLVFVVFDLTDRLSFDAAKTWIEDVRSNIDTTVIVVLIGNKCDLSKNENECIGLHEIERLVQETKCDAYQAVSAKTGHNLENAFNCGLSLFHQLVLEKKVKMQQPLSSSLELPAPIKVGREGCCN